MGQSELIFLRPVFKETIWGGSRLKAEWNYAVPGEHTGECWAISAHPSGDCLVENGRFKGMRLSEVWRTQPQLFNQDKEEAFPLLVKIIDARQDLSIQVHPDDEYANRYEGGAKGKMECWYILDAPEDATLVIGHYARTKEELQGMIAEGKWKKLIREVPVKTGDFIQIDPGTIHAIKGGVMILETQQSSDLTYRVYDYDRLQDGKPRELHIQKSLDVITVPAKPIVKIQSEADCGYNRADMLIQCEYYKIWKLNVSSYFEWKVEAPFLNVSVVEGTGELQGVTVEKGNHFIIAKPGSVISCSGKMKMIVSTENKRKK